MKRLRILVVVVSIPLAALDTQGTAPPAFSGVQGAFFAASVPDLDASIVWYTEKLGLIQVRRRPKQGKMEGALLRGGGLEVELIEHDDATSQRDPMDADGKMLTRGIVKAGFVVADFDGTVSILRARGVDIVFGPFPARPDQRANIIIRDNAGNLIQLFGGFAP